MFIAFQDTSIFIYLFICLLFIYLLVVETKLDRHPFFSSLHMASHLSHLSTHPLNTTLTSESDFGFSVTSENQFT